MTQLWKLCVVNSIYSNTLAIQSIILIFCNLQVCEWGTMSWSLVHSLLLAMHTVTAILMSLCLCCAPTCLVVTLYNQCLTPTYVLSEPTQSAQWSGFSPNTSQIQLCISHLLVLNYLLRTLFHLTLVCCLHMMAVIQAQHLMSQTAHLMLGARLTVNYLWQQLCRRLLLRHCGHTTALSKDII